MRHTARVLAGLILIGAGQLCVFAQEVERRQIGQMMLESVPPWDDAIRERMLQYLNVRPTALADLDDTGDALLISTRFGDTNQLHLVRTPLGTRKQITFFDEPVDGGRFIPGSAGKRVLFSKDRGGDEKDQLYLLDLESGRWKLLTDGKSRHGPARVSRDGRFLAYTSNARSEADFDVYLLDLQSDHPAKRLWDVKGTHYVAGFSPDGTRLLVTHYISEQESNWYILDTQSGQATQINPAEPKAFYGGGAWSHDGKAIYLTTDRDGEFRKLFRLDLDYGKWQALTADIDWDIQSVAADPAGRGIAFIANEDGVSRLYFADNWGNGRKAVTGLPVGVIGGLAFADNGGVLAVSVNSAQSPSDVYSMAFPDGQPRRWTESEIGGLNASTFIEPELIRYPTFDQVNGQPRLIPAFYYRAKQPGKRPVVIMTHGGPEAQYLPTFSSTVQYWANELGISIIAPNVRGSTGYGRSFHQLDNAVKREDSVRDIGALLDWIAKQPELDAERVGIYGGSYGGYMVLGSLFNYPDRIKAGIDIVGIADFITFLQNTGGYRRDLRREEYGDERLPEVRSVLEQISPLAHVDKIKAALFVLHGKNDPRVPVSEAEQIVAKMRELKRPVWYAMALDEGHGFAKKDNRDLSAVLYAHFWEQMLLK